MNLELIATNSRGRSRRETLNGREYIVVPLTMIVPGVLNGSKGALYYPPEEIGKDPGAWNHMPIVVNHPLVNGMPVSARDPYILEKYGIGYVFNTVHNHKLRAEGWFDVEKTRKVHKGILANLEAARPIELSTGLFTVNEPKLGTFNNKQYTSVARNYRPDHLAILPDKKGACSIEDGCGVMVDNKAIGGLAHNDWAKWDADRALAGERTERRAAHKSWSESAARATKNANLASKQANDIIGGHAKAAAAHSHAAETHLEAAKTAEDYDQSEHHFNQYDKHIARSERHQAIANKPIGNGLHVNHIVKMKSGKYRLLSHTGKNLGTFDSHDAAATHEGEVEYFKHANNADEQAMEQPGQLAALLRQDSLDEDGDENDDDQGNNPVAAGFIPGNYTPGKGTLGNPQRQGTQVVRPNNNADMYRDDRGRFTTGDGASVKKGSKTGDKQHYDPAAEEAHRSPGNRIMHGAIGAAVGTAVGPFGAAVHGRFQNETTKQHRGKEAFYSSMAGMVAGGSIGAAIGGLGGSNIGARLGSGAGAALYGALHNEQVNNDWAKWDADHSGGSSVAAKATDTAHSMGEKARNAGQHQEAYKAHLKAASVHERAMKSAKGEAVLAHHDMANHHNQLASMHKEKATELRQPGMVASVARTAMRALGRDTVAQNERAFEGDDRFINNGFGGGASGGGGAGGASNPQAVQQGDASISKALAADPRLQKDMKAKGKKPPMTQQDKLDSDVAKAKAVPAQQPPQAQQQQPQQQPPQQQPQPPQQQTRNYDASESRDQSGKWTGTDADAARGQHQLAAKHDQLASYYSTKAANDDTRYLKHGLTGAIGRHMAMSNANYHALKSAAHKQMATDLEQGRAHAKDVPAHLQDKAEPGFVRRLLPGNGGILGNTDNRFLVA